jgi:hypothetical protein
VFNGRRPELAAVNATEAPNPWAVPSEAIDPRPPAAPE